MKKYLLLLLLATGCGGSSGPGVIINHPLSGQYSGNWNAGGQNGTMTMTIAGNGGLTSAIHNNQFNEDGTITGTMDASGNFNGVIVYPAESTNIQGKMTKNSGNSYTIKAVQSGFGVNVNLTAQLTKN